MDKNLPTKSIKNIITFTDGASSGNPGPGGWGAVLVFLDGRAADDKGIERDQNKSSSPYVIELGGSEKDTTNNRMELTAAIEAISFIEKSFIKKQSAEISDDTPTSMISGIRQNPVSILDEIIIRTDSRYLINGITKWLMAWRKNGWQTKAKKDVINRDLWERLADLVESIEGGQKIEPGKPRPGPKIDWQYVKGHVGIRGNERADAIATAGTDTSKKVELYKGPADKYPFPLDFSGDELAPSAERRINRSLKTGSSGHSGRSNHASRANKARRSRAPAYSYVSFLDGQIMTHATWAECEARVKGKSGAKFKKAIDPAEEKKIIEEWATL